MTTQEVANRLVELCKNGQFDEAANELYGEDIVSIEPKGAPVERVEGRENVLQKQAQFNEMVEEWHGSSVSEPVVANDHFSVAMGLDVTMKGAPRMKMDEIAVYQVRDGKIVHEHFFFTPMPQG
jgi:ketosteroid isomerase-like protein